jgi:hypothetical protein
MPVRTSDRQTLGRVLTMLLPLLFVFLLGGIVGISVVPGAAQSLGDPAWFYDQDCGDLEEPLDFALPSAFSWQPSPAPVATLRRWISRVGPLTARASGSLRRAPPSPLGVV